MAQPLILVLGASTRPERYSHIAVERLVAQGHPVLAIGARTGWIDDVQIRTELPDDVLVDTVTLYVGNAALAKWEDRLLALRPRRIIFNPGSENAQFAERAKKLGIVVVEGCTLVMLSVGTF
ncbi:MAG: CoA-binding protein [Flavobacteriales bacterium]|jgi:predicted CoA-binding protein|nr:CoA-binding protein [Flavobacteriales bacterium]MBP7450257.1 CoA-binding protein [Flavobacteriales bacterium]HOZ41014.1 CoA-binding protein [Flavobacteriales bacterium]